MQINGLLLPGALQSAIIDGLWGRNSRWKKGCWSSLFAKCPRPLPELFNYEAMLRENRLWSKPEKIWKCYLGMTVDGIIPGSIEPRKTVIIGSAEPDSPIALDYRISPPRVVYLSDFGKHTAWVEAAKDVEAVVAALEPITK